MNRGDKPPFFNPNEEDEFLIPPGQSGSMMGRLAPAESEHVLIMPQGKNVVVMVGPVDEIIVVRRVKL